MTYSYNTILHFKKIKSVAPKNFRQKAKNYGKCRKHVKLFFDLNTFFVMMMEPVL